MAESHKSNGNDVFYLVVTSGVVAVGIVALRHSGWAGARMFRRPSFVGFDVALIRNSDWLFAIAHILKDHLIQPIINSNHSWYL